jgi:hypothetical protein
VAKVARRIVLAGAQSVRQANDTRTGELPLDVEPERNTRVQSEDRRQSRGDDASADAWRDLATGELFYVPVGFNASRRRPAVALIDRRWRQRQP